MSTRLPNLQVNIPRTGRLTGLYYQRASDAKKNDDIKIMGVWEQEGDGFFWAPLPFLRELAEKGLAHQVEGQVDKDNLPLLRVVDPQQRVFLLKRELSVNGKARRKIEALAVDQQGNTLTLAAQAVPSCLGNGSSAPAQPSAAGPRPGPAPGAAPAAAPAGVAGPAPSPAPAPNGSQGTSGRDGDALRRAWAEMEQSYGAALAIAAREQLALLEAVGRPLTDLNMKDVQAGAATIIRCLERFNITTVPRGIRKGVLDRLRKDALRHEGLDIGRAEEGVATGSVPTDADSEEETDDLPF